MLPIGTDAAEELQEMSSTLDTIDMSFPHLVEYDEEERLAAFIAASRLETGRSADGLQQVLFKMGIFKEGCLTWHHAHGGVVVNILIFGKKTWTVAPPGLPWFSAQQQKLEQNPGSGGFVGNPAYAALTGWIPMGAYHHGPTPAQSLRRQSE